MRQVNCSAAIISSLDPGYLGCADARASGSLSHSLCLLEGPLAPSPDGLKAQAGVRNEYQRPSPSTDLPRCSHVDMPAGPLPECRAASAGQPLVPSACAKRRSGESQPDGGCPPPHKPDTPRVRFVKRSWLYWAQDEAGDVGGLRRRPSAIHVVEWHAAKRTYLRTRF